LSTEPGGRRAFADIRHSGQNSAFALTPPRRTSTPAPYSMGGNTPQRELATLRAWRFITTALARGMQRAGMRRGGYRRRHRRRRRNNRASGTTYLNLSFSVTTSSWHPPLSAHETYRPRALQRERRAPSRAAAGETESKTRAHRWAILLGTGGGLGVGGLLPLYCYPPPACPHNKQATGGTVGPAFGSCGRTWTDAEQRRLTRAGAPRGWVDVARITTTPLDEHSCRCLSAGMNDYRRCGGSQSYRRHHLCDAPHRRARYRPYCGNIMVSGRLLRACCRSAQHHSNGISHRSNLRRAPPSRLLRTPARKHCFA